MAKKSRLSNLTRFICFTPSLDKNLQAKLEKNNLKLRNQLLLLGDEDLRILYGFDDNEIEEINTKIKQIKKIPAITGIQLDQDTEYIKFGTNGFDQAFGNHGLPTGKLTQIFGEAGSGKSQVCFQLCFQVQLEKSEGGLNGEALYFDTEGSFRPERIYQIAQNYYKNRIQDKNLLKFKLEEILTRIHLRNVNTTADDLYKIIVQEQLDSFLDLHSNIKLFVLDSIAYHFRYDYENDAFTQISQLSIIGKKLKKIAHERNIAILITNQVKLDKQPALGDLWNSTCSTSLYLSRFSNTYPEENEQSLPNNLNLNVKHMSSVRHCFVIKSPNTKSDFSFKYLINEFGIKDYHSSENS